MKNMIVKSFLGTAAVLLLSVAVFAQGPKRIDFAKEGSNALVWEQKVAPGESKSFVFRARKNQKLSLTFIDDTNVGSMDLGKISIKPNTDKPFEMMIGVTKDYRFSVTNNSSESTSFRISISLQNPKKTGKKNQ